MSLIRETSIFSETSQLHCVAPDKSTETGRQQRENFTKPKWKNYDFTMFCPVLLPSTAQQLIDISEYIDCFLLASSLLLKSTDDSFAQQRRLFCLAPSILLLSTDDSFAEHHEYLGQLVNFFLKRYLLSCKMESVRMIDSLLIFTHGY